VKPQSLLFPAIAAVAAPGAAARAPMPSPEYVAGLLEYESMRWCRDLIDYCLDENGNANVAIPSFEVSGLKCRPMPESRAACSFASVRKSGDQITARERCTATFIGFRDQFGKPGWHFARRPSDRRRLSPDPVLTCHQGS
jgi:hypothetical protein